MREPTEWQEDDLLDLIKHKYEENIQLDYKRSDALRATDDKRAEYNKTEISKDVSAFANSIGGTILYGMKESNEPPHYAEDVSPIDPRQTSKEWLEQVINSRIQPRLAGLVINPVELKTWAPGKFAYVVVIPESTTAHQASDKKYYKRFNFESVPMEDYEVRQAMNRSSRPAYKVELLPRRKGSSGDGRSIFRLQLTVENQSDMVGREVSAVLFLPAPLVTTADPRRMTFRGIEYTRMAGTFVLSSTTQLSAIPCVHPLSPATIDFQKEIWLPTECAPFTMVVKVFDQFGLALTVHFKFGLNGFQTAKEIHAAKRSASAFTIDQLE